ncbi:hypothetical protein OS493_004785 [Desmophyllum pertusum]|uniref:Hemicentin-1 n=1 Tax=Desmophyllum pertusum TaxID=174260 RepID=A0A9W9ZGR4_9CNID|nr:hypothetical protein OS493_004785 [Desmophyllum pertusum]
MATFVSFNPSTKLTLDSFSVDGGWSGWSAWSGCADGICAGNQRIRTRTCTNPIPSDDGKYCDGDNAQQLDCLVDGGYTEWSQWSLCDNPCGGSIVNRTRACTNPTPTPDGASCSGDSYQTKLECIFPCPTSPLDGDWSSWTPWTQCSKTCGISGGTILRRTRLCNQPPAMNGGSPCIGNDTDTARACYNPCPVNGGFALWSAWTACSKTCGTGTKSRSRACTNPVPAYQGLNCSEAFDQALSCKLTSCPGAVDGGFTTWSAWTTCSEPTFCLQGFKKRTRTCTNPPAINGGDDCVGLSEENKDCPTVADGCSVFQPSKPDKTAADPKSWLALECGVTEKFSATGANKQDVPFAVYSYFNFMKTELESGWFAIKIEADNKDDFGKKNLTKVCFEIIDPLTIKKVVDNIATYYSKISAIPGWTKTEQTENVPGISIWIDEAQLLRKYEFQCDKSAKYVPISGYEMTDVRFSYYTEGNAQTFKAKGSYTLSTGNVFDTEVKKDVISGTVYAKGKADSATFVDMMASFGINLNALPDFFVNALKGAGLYDFNMKPVEILRKIDKAGVYRFTGTIDIGGVPCHVEIITGIRFGRPTFAVGFSFDSESFGKLSKKLSDIGVDFLDSIGLELQIGLSFHPTEEIGFQQIVTDDETKYSKEPLNSQVTTTVPKGIFAVAQLVLPKDCSGNKFCEITKMILGPTVKWYITGQFEWKKIRVATGFANIRLFDGLYFHKLELYVEADWNATNTHIKLGFRADIKVPVNGEIERDGIIAPSNDLFLFGVLEYDFTEQVVSGKLGMRGMWRKAYWIPWLSLGNIFVGLTYKVGAPIPITGVQFGMRVEFGYDCLIPADFNNDGHCFGGSGYVGVGKPQFFYASITALTLGKIIRLLGFTFQLPPPVASTGFPEGAETSYSTDDFDLRIAGGPYIYKGFMIKGRVNILGWEIYAHIKLSDAAVFVDLKPDPVDILGIAVIARSPTDLKTGPWFYVDSRKAPPFIEALDAAAKSVKAAFDAAKKSLQDAQNAVLEKKAECKRKMSLKCDNCKNLKCKQAKDNCKGFLDAAGKWIGGVVDAAGKWVKKTFKKIGKALAPVGKAIKKVFKGWRKKRELEHMRNENFAVHLRRRRFISKIICEGLVGGTCNAVAYLCEGSCKAVEAIGKGLCNVLDVAVGFLKLTEAATNWVGKAINFLLTAFRVNSILIEFSLSTYAAGGYPKAVFTAAVDLTIFGKDLFLAVSFDLYDVIGSLMVTSDSSTDWYKDKMNPKDATDTEKNYYDNPNPFADFEMSEQFLIENQQSATDDRHGPCLYVESKTDGVLVKVTGCNETDERQNWAYTLKGQVMNSWSQLCIDTNGASKGSKLIQTKCDPVQDDQNFQCDLAVRSIKRRRADQCWTVGTTSLNGPGSLVHLGSLKCIHPSGGGNNVAEGNKMVIYSGCSESQLEFKLENGNLKHTLSGKCVQPIGAVTDGVALGLYSSCGGHQFSFTAGGSLQHVGSKKCVNTKSGIMLPANNDEIVLSSKCENSDVSVNKEHLRFNFIPTDPYIQLDKCTYFDQARLDQRFEVVDESIVSICSKFSRNLAFKKTTEQSSTDYNGFSSRAVDENYSPYYDSKTCMHTKKEQNPWWRVDLGREYIVTDVMIVNRYYYFERLANFEVRVGVNKDNFYNPTCHDRVRTVGQGQALRVQCDPPIPGRYVSVQMFGEGILSMCEVTVYSRVGALADLCQLDNGGCQQSCYNLCNLKVKCGCWPGYTLAYDAKTCIDKDECQSNNGGCDFINGLCINYPGGFQCGCKKGYEIQENSLTVCEDFNECKLNNAGCEHVCNNTGGSFNCDCRAGFKLKSDKMGCEDIDECALEDKGGCAFKCSNYEGGYYCSCDVGYSLMDDDKNCEEIYCPALEAPFRGLITPTSCTDDRENIRRNTACTYGCVSGHNIAGGDQALTCQIDGLWQGSVPFCKPVVCPKLALPDNGGVVPSACSKTDVEYGTRCVFYCGDGYALSGPRYTTCQDDTSWSEIAPLSCVRVYTDPWIACPIDRVEELGTYNSTVVLGWKWQLPRTNMKIVTVSPSNYNENYPFLVGRHRATWIGTSDSGTQLSCSFHITVNDVTPPLVQNCPASFVVKTSALKEAITWTPPAFTDNVAVASVLSNREPGFIMDTYTSITVRYTASDAAANVVYCTFNISLDGLQCPTIPSPAKGNAQQIGTFFLQLTCQQGYFFNPAPAGSPNFEFAAYTCTANKWVSNNDRVSVLHKAPDCMKYVAYTAGEPCPGGTILLPDNSVCVNCHPGTYSDSKTNTCKDCTAGFYQDEEGKTECQPCPKNYSTAITGSKNKTDCRRICRAGRYSTNNGVCPCKRCPYGTYQENEQMTTCKACPTGTNTTYTGRTSIDDCIAPVSITGTIPTADFSVNENETISIVCNVEGSPAPTATWTKISGSPPSSDRVKINSIYDLDSKLTGVEYVISGAIAADTGTYECKATNAHSNDAKQIKVDVKTGLSG